MANLILIRGYPGSGKTELANKMSGIYRGILHLENDMFLMSDFKYNWSPDRVKQAINLCTSMVKMAIANGTDVIVANTFTKRKYIQYYKDLADKHGAKFSVYRCIGNFNNLHGLDSSKVDSFKRSMEDWPGEIIYEPED